MLDNLILNARFCGLILISSLLFLGACSRSQEEPIPPQVEVRTVEVKRPAPIVPEIDQLKLRSIEWKIITPDNIQEVFDRLPNDAVLFAVTSDGYESLSLNLSDVRGMIQQQQRVIAIYKESFNGF